MNVQNEEDREASSNEFEQENIEGTPFIIVTKENKSFIAIGSNRITDLMDYEEAREMIARKDWELITNTIIRLVKNIEQIDRIENKNINK